MAASSRAQVVELYRRLIRESRNFPSYNYRTYALRRIRDSFRENRSVDDPRTLQQLLNKAQNSLTMIQRQVSIGQMYETQRTVLETDLKTST